jgi:hypothetical protein
MQPVLMQPVLMLPVLILPVLILPVLILRAVSKKLLKLRTSKRVFNLQRLRTGSARLEVYFWLLDILPITAKTVRAVVATVASSLIMHYGNRPNRKI